ncbi:MAG TPA: hypothetical protein VJ938_05450 [Acidimicrobiia bacterium]|nr:hypothetical protein [Acidimicrobiia bacterium]
MWRAFKPSVPAAIALAVTLLVPVTSVAEELDFSPGSIGVIGCSNTAQHVDAYLPISGRALLANVGNLGGGTLARWYANEGDYWEKYDKRAPVEGYGATWIQICLRATENPEGVFTATHVGWIRGVVAEVRQRFGNIPIFVSPLNFYEGAEGCLATGPRGQAVTVEVADWAAANLGVFRGPDTGPMDVDQLASDGCHLNASGQTEAGRQLVRFFDGGTRPRER